MHFHRATHYLRLKLILHIGRIAITTRTLQGTENLVICMLTRIKVAIFLNGFNYAPPQDSCRILLKIQAFVRTAIQQNPNHGLRQSHSQVYVITNPLLKPYIETVKQRTLKTVDTIMSDRLRTITNLFTDSRPGPRTFPMPTSEVELYAFSNSNILNRISISKEDLKNVRIKVRRHNIINPTALSKSGHNKVRTTTQRIRLRTRTVSYTHLTLPTIYSV